MNRKLFIFTESPTGGYDYRVRRIIEETRKLSIDPVVISLRNILITDEGILSEGIPLEIHSKDKVLPLSNSLINHLVARHIPHNNLPHHYLTNALQFSDKFLTSLFFQKHSIPTPKTIFINNLENIRELSHYVNGFPCILKKTIGSKGKYVEIVSSELEIITYIKHLYQLAADEILGREFQRNAFLLQEYIPESNGSDFRALCINGELLGVIKREALHGFKANISLGGKASFITDPPLAIREMSLHITKVSSLFLAGIDYIQGKDGKIFAIEINTSPQFEGFERTTGINIAQRIVHSLFQ